MKTHHTKTLLTTVAALIAAATVTQAQATTVSVGGYTAIFQGVDEATATVNGNSASVVRIDLTAPGISFTTTPLAAGDTPNTGTGFEVNGQTTSQFLRSTGVAVAIDANQYTNNDNAPTGKGVNGLQISNGTLVSPDQSGFEALLIGANNQTQFAAGGSVGSLTGVADAIAGQQGLIVSLGANTNLTDNQAANRAGLGVSQSGQYMYLVDANSLQLGDEANLLEDLGAYNAINLNGGGSAALDVSDGTGGVIDLNHTTEKFVGTNLGIYAAPLAPVPLPPALGLFGSGLVGLIGLVRLRRRNISSLVALSTLFSLVAMTQAEAQTFSVGSYTPIYQGISETTATIQGTAGTSVAYIVKVDLDAPGISFTTTPHSGPQQTMSQTTSQFLQSTGTEVAINATPFDTCCSTATSQAETLDSLAVFNGSVVAPDKSGFADLLLTAGNKASMVAGGTANLTGVKTAVGGFQFVLDNGVNVSASATGGDPLGVDPRTIIGLSQNDEFMYLVAIDGRQPGYSAGVTQSEEANFMSGLGAYDAINFDGGGSTALVTEAANGSSDVLNVPSGGAERYDGNNLGIYAAPLAPVPLPPSVFLFASALLGMVPMTRRRIGA